MGETENLWQEIEQIKKRNVKVETDKAWETSWTRKIVIFVLTYLAITIYFFIADLPSPVINSFVPALAFVISTLSLPFFKKQWEKHIYKI